MQKSENVFRGSRCTTTQSCAVLVLCSCALMCSGCFTRKPPTNHAPAFAFAHPVIPSKPPVTTVEAPPDIALEIVPAPRLITPRSAPTKPRVAQTAPSEPAVVQQPADPIIVPDLTLEQSNAAKSEAQHSLEIAEWNLSQTQGKKLNTAQEDVASKIRGFMDTARDAMKNSDWQRAKNLAKKAEVLSHELVTSL